MNVDKDKVKKLLKSDSGKTLASNFASLTVLQIIGYVFPLITMPYLARTIGVDGFGKIALGASVIAYFQTIVDWGFRFSAVRDIAKNKDDIDFVSKTYCNAMASKIVLMILSAIVLFVLVQFIPFFNKNSDVLFATFLLIPGYIFFPEWLFQAMEKMKYITIMSFISKCIFTSLVFLIIHDKEDYIFEPILTALGYSVSGLIATVYAIRKFKLKLRIPHFSEIFQTLNKGKDIFLTQFIPTIYNNLAVILLNVFGGQTATGIYSSGYKFIGLTEQFSNVLSRTFYPFLARRIDKHQLYVKLSGTLSICIGLFLFIFADLLVRIFYTSEFASSATVIRIMSITPFFLFLMDAYGTNGLMLIGKESLLRKIILYCSLFGMVLSFIAVYKWTYIGVAITLVAVWGIRGGITTIYCRKYTNKNNEL